MRWRFVGVIIFFSLLEVVLGAALLGPTLLSGVESTNVAREVTTQLTPTTDNPIAYENAQTGSSDWKIPAVRQATTQIQAYASATSVAPGKDLTFYVSTQQEGMQYWLDIYRQGWYGGEGGRLMFSTIMYIPATVSQVRTSVRWVCS